MTERLDLSRDRRAAADPWDMQATESATAPSSPPTGWLTSNRWLCREDDVKTKAIVMADPTGVIRFWSPGAEVAFGFTATQAIGASLDLIVPAKFRAAHWTAFGRAMKSGSADLDGRATPFPVARADGSVTTASGRLTLVRDPAGHVVTVKVVFE